MNHVGDLISGLEDTVEELEQTFKENEKFKRTHENKIQHIWYRVKKKTTHNYVRRRRRIPGKIKNGRVYRENVYSQST